MSDVSPEHNLQKLTHELETVTADARREFNNLSAEQLNWKPGAEAWSIGQCLDHLITTNRHFFTDLDQIISGEKKKTLWESLPLLPTLFGRIVVNATNPKTARKVKSPKIFAPASSSVDASIVEKFIEHQGEVASKLKALEKVDARKVKVTSPITKFVAYSLLDACTIMVNHEQRHVEQAQRVLESSGFPR